MAALLALALPLAAAQPATSQANQPVRLAQPNWWPYTFTSVNVALPDLNQWSKPLREDVGRPGLGLFSESGMINNCLAEMILHSGIERRNLAFVTPLQLISYTNDSYAVK